MKRVVLISGVVGVLFCGTAQANVAFDLAPGEAVVVDECPGSINLAVAKSPAVFGTPPWREQRVRPRSWVQLYGTDRVQLRVGIRQYTTRLKNRSSEPVSGELVC